MCVIFYKSMFQTELCVRTLMMLCHKHRNHPIVSPHFKFFPILTEMKMYVN